MNNNNLLNPQPTATPRQTRAPLGHPQPAQPDYAFWAVAQHPQQSHFQAPPPPAYNPQRTVSQPLLPPPPEQSANYDYGSQWHGQQQHLYHVPPPVAQPPPQLVVQPNYHLYQPTAGYPQHYVPQPVESRRPQLAYYSHPQMPARRQRFDSPNLNPQAQQHAPPPYQPQFPSPAVFRGQSQRLGRGDGDGWPNNVPLNANKGGQSRNRGGSRGRRGRGRGARGGSMSGNRGEIADSGRGGSHMDSGGGGTRAGQSGGGVCAPWSEGNLGGAASIQAEGRNAIPTSAEPAAVPVATQLQGAQINMRGNPRFTNIGVNKGKLTTVNNYGGTHGLENLKEFISFAALHDSAEQDPVRRCHAGTRENVLNQLRYWFDNPNATDCIIWLHGPAGAGKSAIAQTIADEYNERGMAATFFFFRSDPSRNDGNRLFPTIAWQLAFSIPPTKDFIVHALDKTPHLPTKAIELQFEQLVVHPFQPTNNIASQMSQPAPVVIIDGVDECSDEKLQQRFLAVIGNAVKNHRVPLRFLIASRPEALIEETLNKFKDFTVSIDLAKLDDSNRDIQKYLEDKFSEIAFNRDLDPTWPGQIIIEEIVSKSSGNFIFASLVIRFISDEDYDPEFLLRIVLDLAPRGNMSPFALLDQLFLEILKRQRDQDFLKTILAVLVARSFVLEANQDDATFMNVSEKDLHIRLRRMRSLLTVEPFIYVYHESFFDFLQDSSRSGQYHISKESGLKRYLELIVDSVVRHVSMAIGQPNRHGTCRSSPKYTSILEGQLVANPMIALPVEVWQEALKPLLGLQDKLLKTSRPQSCRVTQVMRHLLLHLFLQGKSHSITAARALESNMNETVTECGSALATEAQQHIPQNDLDSCLSALLFCLQKTDTMVIDGAIIDRMSSLLAFNYAETMARVRTISDAQKLVDLIALLTNNESFLNQCGRDVACRAARLASEIFARVPLRPQSLFPMNTPSRLTLNSLELTCQSAFISRILDHNYIVPVLGICRGGDMLRLASGNENESVNGWLKRSRPDLITRIKVILEVARTIRYLHSMDVALDSCFINPDHFLLDSNLRAKFKFIGLFAWWAKEAPIYGHEDTWVTSYTYESNIHAFAKLFYSVFFEGHGVNLFDRQCDDVMQLIARCWAEDPKSRPTMKDVVTEMETWDLT